jgi:class 3 adenylate cyclase
VNVAARLGSAAQAGEVVVSDVSVVASKLELQNSEARTLSLKGKTEPVGVRVLRAAEARDHAMSVSAR